LPCRRSAGFPGFCSIHHPFHPLTGKLVVSRVVLGAPQRRSVIDVLRGNVIHEVSNSLLEDIDLLVYA